MSWEVDSQDICYLEANCICQLTSVVLADVNLILVKLGSSLVETETPSALALTNL